MKESPQFYIYLKLPAHAAGNAQCLGTGGTGKRGCSASRHGVVLHKFQAALKGPPHGDNRDVQKRPVPLEQASKSVVQKSPELMKLGTHGKRSTESDIQSGNNSKSSSLCLESAQKKKPVPGR
jgi:hypothetical protein